MITDMEFRTTNTITADGLPENFQNTCLLLRKKTPRYIYLLYAERDKTTRVTGYKLQIISVERRTECWLEMSADEIESSKKVPFFMLSNGDIMAVMMNTILKKFASDFYMSGYRGVGQLKVELKCTFCGKQFERGLSQLRAMKKITPNAGKYCSKSCFWKYLNKHAIRDKRGGNIVKWSMGENTQAL